MNKQLLERTLVALGLVLLALLLIACGGTMVRNGTARDTLWGVEPVANGNVRIFLTHDDVAGYCTVDPELGNKAMSLLREHNGEVIIRYDDITDKDKEADWFQNSACGSISVGDGTMKMFKLISIEPVRARSDPGR